ncbi:MAG: hypothetical protein ABFS19_12190, partial [Thermodesulfobacteriota bacterium]
MDHLFHYSFDDTGSIGLIELDNPPSNGFLDPVFTDRDQLTDFLNQPSLKAVLFRGRGRHFSAGADLASLEGLAREPLRFQEA